MVKGGCAKPFQLRAYSRALKKAMVLKRTPACSPRGSSGGPACARRPGLAIFSACWPSAEMPAAMSSILVYVFFPRGLVGRTLMRINALSRGIAAELSFQDVACH
jgi:hypothetical protein